MTTGLVEELICMISGESLPRLNEETPRELYVSPRILFEWPEHLDACRSGELESLASKNLAKEQLLAGLGFIRSISGGSASALSHFASDRIQEACLGSAMERRLLITASSPQELGRVWFAASWESLTAPRIAASILHEAVHQELYRRELAGDTPWRHNSIAYAPWKQRERSGRWVWHAFWTFSVHCVFLADSIDIDGLGAEEDIAEVAAKYLRLKQCLESLELFNVVEDRNELSLIRSAANSVFLRIECGANYQVWADQVNRLRPAINREFEAWVQRIVSYKPGETHDRSLV